MEKNSTGVKCGNRYYHRHFKWENWTQGIAFQGVGRAGRAKGRRYLLEFLYKRDMQRQKDSFSFILGFYSFHLKEEGWAAVAAQKIAKWPGSSVVAQEEHASRIQKNRYWTRLWQPKEPGRITYQTSTYFLSWKVSPDALQESFLGQYPSLCSGPSDLIQPLTRTIPNRAEQRTESSWEQ